MKKVLFNYNKVKVFADNSKKVCLWIEMEHQKGTSRFSEHDGLFLKNTFKDTEVAKTFVPAYATIAQALGEALQKGWSFEYNCYDIQAWPLLITRTEFIGFKSQHIKIAIPEALLFKKPTPKRVKKLLSVIPQTSPQESLQPKQNELELLAQYSNEIRSKMATEQLVKKFGEKSTEEALEVLSKLELSPSHADAAEFLN